MVEIDTSKMEVCSSDIIKLSQDLEILYENGATLASHVGFYHFNCDATFANYYATSNADEVSAKVPSEPVYCGFLED